MTLEFNGARQHVGWAPAQSAERIGGHQACAHRGGRRSEPTAERNPVAAGDLKSIEIGQPGQHRAAQQVGGVGGHLIRPLTLHVHLQWAGAAPDEHLVGQVERQRQDVETGA
ncbi:MAG: hypothetical protein ABGX91_01505 [Thermoleophilia bacterium]